MSLIILIEIDAAIPKGLKSWIIVLKRKVGVCTVDFALHLEANKLLGKHSLL